MDPIHCYYAKHGRVSTPGRLARRLDELPAQLQPLCRAIRGLVLHYRSEEAGRLPVDRLDEVRTRRASSILARIVELEPRELSETRLPKTRILGCCRDFALLLCSALRHRGIPSRVRVGFADYLGMDLFIDHWLVEYWDAVRSRWVLVDAEQADVIHDRHGRSFDPLDVPRDRFVGAGRAWIMSRKGKTDPSRFGYDPETTGMSVVRSNLLHDVACLNKTELTPWDSWGLGLTDVQRLRHEDLLLLDRVAALSESTSRTWSALRELYESDPRVRVPRTITTWSVTGERSEALV